MDFKTRLKQLRLETGVSQQTLGNLLCVSKMCVSHWEKGNSEPSIEQLIAMAKYFDVSVDYLVGLDLN